MIIAPSVLSLDYDKFNEELKILNSNVEYIHFDVMDGHFVPNLSFGPHILKTFRKNSDLFMDVHLMVDDPSYYSDVFIDAGADGITFHFESFNNVEYCLQLIEKIKNRYVKVGISIKPNTPVSMIYPLLKHVDLVLVMSVEPGFGGQAFIPFAYDKIKELSKIKAKYNLNYLIQVDGGVSDKNIRELVEAGVECVVAGSYIFKGDIKHNIDVLRKANKKQI